MDLGDGSADIAILVGVGAVALAALVVLIVRGRRSMASAGAGAVLSDGIVLMIGAGRVLRASPGAEDRLGSCDGSELASLLAPIFGTQARLVVSAVETMEESGQPFHIMLRDTEERLHEAAGRPQGALVRLTLREAAHVDAELRGLRRRLGQAESEHELLAHQLAGLQELMARGAMAMWTRSPDGLVNWSDGSVVTADGTVPAEVVALVASGRAGARSGGGDAPREPLRARVQVDVPGSAGTTVALDTVEVGVGGEARQVVGFAVDGSHAAAAEKSLVRFVRTMTDTFAHLKAGLAIFDRTGKLFLFNPALAAIWRADPAWLATRPTLREILDDLRIRRRLPELTDFHDWRNRLVSLFERPEAAEAEHVWHLADGANIRVLVRPHPDGALAFVFDDITERIRLEQSYRTSIDLRHAILDRLDEGIAVFGPDGQVQFVNQAFHRVWSFDPGAVTRESHAREVIPLCAGATCEEGVWRRLEGFITGEESRGSWGARLTTPAGRALSARFSPLPDGSTMTVFADVTDSERIALALRERNEALEAAEAMRSELLDEISYRLRTPLNAVAGFSELLLDLRTGTLTETQRDYAQNILAASQQLNEAVSGVSDMVEMPDEALAPTSGPVFIEDVIEHTRRLLERRAGERDVRLRTGLEAPIGDVTFDAARMGQIVFSLAHDAINRCPPGGAVVLGATRGEGGTLQVWTSETLAPGEAEDAPERLPGFELLRRQVALENGFVEIDRRRDGAMRVTCRFFPRPGLRPDPIPDERADERLDCAGTDPQASPAEDAAAAADGPLAAAAGPAARARE